MTDKAPEQPSGRSRWRNSAMAIHIALPNSFFDELGVPRLAA